MIIFLRRLFRIKRAADKVAECSIEEEVINQVIETKNFNQEDVSCYVENCENVVGAKDEIRDENNISLHQEILINPVSMGFYEPTLDLREYRYPSEEVVSNIRTKDWIRQFINRNSSFCLPLAWSIQSDVLICKDLVEIKNIFIVGTQSTGKTTFLNQHIISLLFSKHPSHLKIVFADCKGIEFSVYQLIEKHFIAKLPGKGSAIVTETKGLVHTLNALCIEMDNRYDLMKHAGARTIAEYNDKFVRRQLNPEKGHQYLPFIALIIDDLSGFTLTGGNEVNIPLIRLINEGYKTGLFNIISTSQFSVFTLANNLLSLIRQRVVFRLNNKDDYRKFFDTIKLNRFINEGDFLYNENARICEGGALQISYLDIENITRFIGGQRGYTQAFLLPEYLDETEIKGKDFHLADRDSLFEDAARLVVQSQSGSTSLLQRRMKLGYNRAGLVMDQLEAAGIVGPNQGSKVREVLIKTEADLQQQLSLLG